MIRPTAIVKKNVCLLCVAGGFFVTGINLTEDLKYICTHPTESLKDLVMSTYPTLLSWVKEQTPGSRVGSLNIIAGDFITESHFVPTVVKLNEKLLKWSLWLSTVNLHYSTLEKKKCESQHEIHTSLFFIIVTGEKKDSSTWIIHRHVDALIGSSEMYISVWKLLEKKQKKKQTFWYFQPALVCLHSVHYICNVLYQLSRSRRGGRFYVTVTKAITIHLISL